MLAVIIRSIKRLLLLVPGVLVTNWALRNVFPTIHNQTSWFTAALLTYILVAYVFIPLVIRIIRRFVRPSHVPLYSITPDGLASDPVNIALVGTKQEAINAMKRAGWRQADEKTPRTILRVITSTILKRPYPTAPFSNLYLLGRKQDFGFQLPIVGNKHHRHHVRFWAASHTSDPRKLEHITFWEQVHASDLVNKRVLWVGAASLDAGIGIIRHNAQITHMIHPDTDAERELIATQLQDAGVVKSIRSVKTGEPYKLTNRVLTGYLRSDGKIKVCEL